AGCAAGKVFIVIHDDDAIDGVGNGLVIEIFVADLNADVELHSLGMQVGRKLVQQRDVARLSLLGKGLEIDHQAAVAIGGEKESDLMAEAGARRRIIEEVGDDRTEVVAVEILDHGEDFHIGVFRLEERHDFFVNRTHLLILNHVEHRVCVRINGLQVAIGAQNLQPCGKQQVDLAGILPQRGIAGRVPGNIEGGANTFLGIERDLRRMLAALVCASSAGNGGKAAFFASSLFFALFQSVIGALFRSPRQVGKGLVAECAVKEKDDEQSKGDGNRVKDASNALPARLQGIEK